MWHNADRDVVRLHAAVGQYLLDGHANRRTTTPDRDDHGRVKAAVENIESEME